MVPKPYDLQVLRELSEQKYHALKELADCHSHLGQFELAGPLYEKAVTLRPDLHEAYLGLGLLAVQVNQLELGEQALHRALECKIDCAGAYAALAVIHQRRGEFAPAFDDYLKALDLDTDNLLALLGLFQTSVKMGSFAKIIHYLELYLDTHPNDTSVLFCLATLYGKEAKYDQARELLLRILRVEPGKIEAANLLRKLDTVLQVA